MADQILLIPWYSLTSPSSSCNLPPTENSLCFERTYVVKLGSSEECRMFFLPQSGNLFISSKFLVPCNLTYSQALGIRVWASLGSNPANQKKSQTTEHVWVFVSVIVKSTEHQQAGGMKPGGSMLCSAFVQAPQWRPVHLHHPASPASVLGILFLRYSFEYLYSTIIFLKIQFFCFLSLSP